jgi:DNA repair exonuclease SbcCD ATPase subunit
MTNLADAFGARGVQTFVLQNAIEALQTISQTYLDELSDGSQRLELSLDAGDRISRKAMVRSPGGGFVERPLSSLSGGQWRRCSLALSLGFADLVARRGRLKTSLCVLDEPLTHLDRSGRSSVGRLLRGLLRQGERGGLSNSMSVSTILLILQDLAAEELEESFDHIDEVTKDDGLSFVSVDEQS